MKRYTVTTDTSFGVVGPHGRRAALVESAFEDPEGAWVRFEDVEPNGDGCDNCGNAIDGMQAASSDVCWDCWQGAKGTIERLEARNKQLGDELGRSELTIAKLERELEVVSDGQ